MGREFKISCVEDAVRVYSALKRNGVRIRSSEGV